MTESQQPKFQWGQPVAAASDLFNDGTFPGEPEGALLVKAGDKGEIVQIGAHTDTGAHVYLVEFTEKRVVGCLEGEIHPV